MDRYLTAFAQVDLFSLVNTIRALKGNIYLLGTGKSGNMARHCADLLKSVSIPAFYADSTDLLHGNIGCVTGKDLVILFSRSGNTAELVKLVPYFKAREVQVWGVTNAPRSTFDTLCDVVLRLPFDGEMPGEVNQIPTHSCLAQLIFSNLLVSCLKGGLTLAQYTENHPAGTIGANLKKIKDVLVLDFPKMPIGPSGMPLNEIFFQMTRYKMGACFFTDGDNRLIGLLTDGDIRRLLLKNATLTRIEVDHLTVDFYSETDSEKLLVECKPYHFIPVMTKAGLLQGILFNGKQV
jgi:D-arabinose 5-phosphate isomerase GutQ